MFLFLAFLGMLLVSFALFAFFTRQTPMEKAVQQRVGDIQQARHQDRIREQDAARILKINTPGRFEWLDNALRSYRFSFALETLSMQAGAHWTAGAFTVYSLAAAAFAFVAGYFVFPLIAVQAIFGAAGLFAPYLYLKRRRSTRLHAFNTALPDAIDLMARALRAGHSVSSAIEVLSEQAGDAVRPEFEAVFRQQNFGLPLREALTQMSARIPSNDLRFVVTAILVQKETGGNLTEILDRTTEVIRERVRIEGEVRVRTAQGRLTGWILSLLPVILLFLMSIVNPDYSHVLLHDPVGQHLLYLGVALITVGAFIIRRIVDIKV